jgi:hypothetical protein
VDLSSSYAMETGRAGAEQLRSLLSAMGELAAEHTVAGRLDQLLQLSVRAVDADHAVLAVQEPGDRPASVLFSSPGEEVAAELRALLDPHLGAVAVPAADRFRARALDVDREGPPERRRPVLEVPITITTGRSSRLFIVGRPGERFATGDEELAAEFAKVAALVVENAVHTRQTEQQVRWLQSLTLITQALLQAGADELSVWQEIADRVHQLARARTVTICTTSEDDAEQLEVRVVAGVGEDELAGRVFDRAGTLVGHAMDTGTWQYGGVGHAVTPHAEVGPPVGPTLAIPLLGVDGERGAIELSRSPEQASFDRDEVVMVHDFANQAVLAVELAETRAAERRLTARTVQEEVTGTFQDRTIQRLFAMSLTVESALARRSEPWLVEVHTQLTEIIQDARSSLDVHYGRPG